MNETNSYQGGSNGIVATTYPKILMQGAKPTVVQNDNATSEERTQSSSITNEYVLNVAFYTFVGFLLSEAVFAVIAGSESMLEDAEAMSVDALTYLFNLWAEKIKNRPYTEAELQLPIPVRDYRREMTRLYVELIPPFLSVSTLVVVTIFATRDALEEFLHSGEVVQDENGVATPDVNVNIMLWFSGANLLLDLVNVTCFARANQAFGLSIPSPRRQQSTTNGSGREMQSLLEQGSLLNNNINDTEEICMYHNEHSRLSRRQGPVDSDSFVNLNMCSAWTVRFLFVCFGRFHRACTTKFSATLFEQCSYLCLITSATACLRRHVT
jgi:hypothetical protein